MISNVDGWIVSPRKSRKKSACFSSTITSMPARASRKPSITPAGPPPAMEQRVVRASGMRFGRREHADEVLDYRAVTDARAPCEVLETVGVMRLCFFDVQRD